MALPDKVATTKLEETSCCNCGIAFCVPLGWVENKREHGTGFYCPNGHSLVFKESGIQKLERELREEKNRHWQTKMELGQEQAKRKQLEKRIAHGVCPYCKRTFKQLARHMKCKHPEKHDA